MSGEESPTMAGVWEGINHPTAWGNIVDVKPRDERETGSKRKFPRCGDPDLENGRDRRRKRIPKTSHNAT